MSESLYKIAKAIVPEKDARKLLSSRKHNQQEIKSFSNPRIAGTQCLVDYFLFEQGDYPHTLDVTQFFRTEEPFSRGYTLAQKVIAPVIRHSVVGNNNHEYKNLLDFYARTLQTGDCKALESVMKELAEKGQKSSLSLLEGKFIERPKNTVQYDGKMVVVTGSNTGIGREIALEFARRGAEVIFHYPNDDFSRGALSAVELVREYKEGTMAEAYQGDFRTLEGIDSFADLAFRQGIDILVNNAGITLSKPFEETSQRELESIVNVNLIAQYILAQKAIKQMIKQKRGIIINMSSNHGIAGKAGHSAYAMTKAGVLGLTRELAMEYARKNIRINAIIPGGVITESHLILMPNFAEIGKKGKPINHWNNPRDIANGICWLCSEEARNITGQQLIIDCGMSAALTGGADAVILPDVAFGKRFMR